MVLHSPSLHLLPACISLLVSRLARSGKISPGSFIVYPRLQGGVAMSAGVLPAAGGDEIGDAHILPELPAKKLH